MALNEKIVLDMIEILENGIIQIRQANIVEKDGKEIARNYNRYVLVPGDDLSAQDLKIVAIAKVVWTKEIIDSYKESLKTNNVL